MAESKKQYRSILILALCAVVCGFVLATRVSPRVFSGNRLHSVVDGDFYTDSWVGEQATVEIPRFASIANVVSLRFDPVRVGASEPARIQISACESAPVEYTVTNPDPIAVSLPFGCSPARISIRPLNLYVPAHEKTPRRLGVQLREVSVAAVAGIPLVSARVFAVFSGLMGALALLAYRIATSLGLPGLVAGYLGLALPAVLLSMTRLPENKLKPVAVVIVALLAGVALCPLVKTAAAEKERRFGGILLAIALLVGAALRFYGITFGLPSNFHPDEVPKVNAIMRMVERGSLDPQYFLHPSLLLYSTYGLNVVLHFFGIKGEFRETAFLAGRLVSACAGVASIALTYGIGRRLYSREVGGFAALLLAVFPLHVTCSRYLKEDSLLTFLVLSCVLVTLIAVQSQRRWLLLVAGLLAGCTAGAKYSGILMVVVPASVPWIASRKIKPDWQWMPWVCAACVIAPLGFLLTTPYALLNSAKFLQDFHSEQKHMQVGHTVAISAWSQLWMYHFWRSIRPGITPVVTVLSVIACGFLLRRARLEDLLVVAMLLLFYLPAEYVKAKPAPQPERYILPCLPFLALALAEFVRQLGQSRRKLARPAVSLCALGLVLTPFSRSVSLAKDVRNDTRDQLAEWMKQHIPAGSKVLMDWQPYCPNFHGAHFTIEQIHRARIFEGLKLGNLRNSDADYLILSSLFYNRYFSQPESPSGPRERYREVFQRVPVITQLRASSGTYGFHNPTITLFSLAKEDFKRLDDEVAKKMRGELAQTSNEVRAQARW